MINSLLIFLMISFIQSEELLWIPIHLQDPEVFKPPMWEVKSVYIYVAPRVDCTQGDFKDDGDNFRERLAVVKDTAQAMKVILYCGGEKQDKKFEQIAGKGAFTKDKDQYNAYYELEGTTCATLKDRKCTFQLVQYYDSAQLKDTGEPYVKVKIEGSRILV